MSIALSKALSRVEYSLRHARTSEEQRVEQHALAHAAARVGLDEDMVVEPPGLVRLEQPHPPVVHGLHG